MTEREKMLSGELYDPTDKELEQLRLNARKLARKYNSTDEDQTEEQARILQELLPTTEELPYLQAPVYFDYGCNTFFGKLSSANFNFTCLDVCEIHIGDNVMIGPNVTLATPMHPLLPEERNIRKREDGSFYNLEYAKPITIKDNCWLASNVVVCGGVTIGEGCVIGAGSVVTKDIPPYSLAVGNPCRVIRKITEKDHMPDGKESKFINQKSCKKRIDYSLIFALCRFSNSYADNDKPEKSNISPREISVFGFNTSMTCFNAFSHFSSSLTMPNRQAVFLASTSASC